MPPKASGQFCANDGKKGVAYGLRFRLPDGRRVYEKLGVGYGPDAISRREAEERAERLLAKVKLGAYRTKEEREADRRARKDGRDLPVFAAFAEEWLERRRVLGGTRGRGLSASGEADLRWRLDHLIAWFGAARLDEVDEADVEAYAAAKRDAEVGEGGLGVTSVNKTLSTLEAVLGNAVRYRLVDRNAATGFRLPGVKYVAPSVRSAAGMTALLDAAGALDRARRCRRGHGRALLATLLFGGLRIGEALALRWSDVNLATGTLRVRDGKTVNAARDVDLLPPLRDELAELKARRGGAPADLVFATATGEPDSRGNLRKRLLMPAVEAANAALAEAGEEAIPADLSLHGLRHTCATVLLTVGEEAGYVADQLGHADAGFTYSRYRKKIARRDGEAARLRTLFFGESVDLPGEGGEVSVTR